MRLFSRDARIERQLRSLLKGHEVPTFPAMTMRILERVRDSENSVQDVAEALQWDPGLVVRILRAVNSAAYAPARPIASVGHAVSYMGRSQLEQVVLALVVRDALPAEPAKGFDARRYWRTAAFRAALSRGLAERIHPQQQAHCFTVGLLQDMAIPVLAIARPDDYGPLLERWHLEAGSRLDRLEHERFGWTHGRVGGLLARGWNLPADLVRSIEDHHRDDRGDAELLPAVRLVALLRETGAEHGLEALVEVARSDYGLPPDWTLETVASCRETAGELASQLL